MLPFSYAGDIEVTEPDVTASDAVTSPSRDPLFINGRPIVLGRHIGCQVVVSREESLTRERTSVRL